MIQKPENYVVLLWPLDKKAPPFSPPETYGAASMMHGPLDQNARYIIYNFGSYARASGFVRNLPDALMPCRIVACCEYAIDRIIKGEQDATPAGDYGYHTIVVKDYDEPIDVDINGRTTPFDRAHGIIARNRFNSGRADYLDHPANTQTKPVDIVALNKHRHSISSNPNDWAKK